MATTRTTRKTSNNSNNSMWKIFDSILDHTQETNMCHEMAVKIAGGDDIEIIFSGSTNNDSDDDMYEVCSVDSYSSHYGEEDFFSEPSNSLLLEEEIEEGRATTAAAAAAGRRRSTKKAKRQGSNNNSSSMLSTSMSTATTETSSTRTRTISNSNSKNTATKSVFVDIDEFQQEQDQRDRERRQQRRQQKRERNKSSTTTEQEEQDEQDTSKNNHHHHQGPLQRKQSEETEDSDIDDSLVFDDDFVAEFDNEDNVVAYDDDEDLIMVVDDDDIDDNEVLTRLIDIHVGDMMDGSEHMEKISMRLRPSFDLPSAIMPTPPPSTSLVELPSNSISPMMQQQQNYSKSSRRQLVLPQIVEQEAEDDQDEGGSSRRQAFIEEIQDPRLRTLLKTIHRRSNSTERFDMDALLESLKKEINAHDPTIHSALENLSSRIMSRSSNNKKKNAAAASEIEEIDLDLFFDDIRKGVVVQQQQQQEQQSKSTAHKNAPRFFEKQKQTKEKRLPISEELALLDNQIVLERGMSSLTMGHKTCGAASPSSDSVLRALHTNLGSNNKNSHNENKKPHYHSTTNFFGRTKNTKPKKTTKKTPAPTTNDNTTIKPSKNTSTQPFSTLNNKTTSLSSRLNLKKKLTRGGTKMSKTVGKLLSSSSSSSKTTTTPTVATTEYAATNTIRNDTPTTLGCSSGSSHDGIPCPPSLDNDDDIVEVVPENKSRMAKLWQKTKHQGRTHMIGGRGGGRESSYQTLDPIGKRAAI